MKKFAILFTLASVVALVLAFPPFSYSALIWLALVPWLVAIDRNPKQAAKLSFLLGGLSTALGSYWIVSALEAFAQLSMFFAVVGYLAFSAFNGFSFVLYAKWRRQWRSRPIFFIAAALGYVAIDALWPKLFRETLGQATFNESWMRQIAEIGGVTFVTFAIVLVNELLAAAWVSPGKNRLREIATAALILISIAVFGRSRIISLNASVVPTVSVVGVQANIGNAVKLATRLGEKSATSFILDRYLALSESSLERKPKLIVWPETAYPLVFGRPRDEFETKAQQRIFDFVSKHGIALAFGGYDYSSSFEKFYNGAYVVAPGVPDFQRYRKSILLPFGDYIPGLGEMPFLRKKFPMLGQFGQGRGATVLTVNTDRDAMKLTPVICYEALFSDYLIAGSRLGANLILNLTNDSWFGSHGEPELHLSNVIFRSIETRLPQLRVTNTGISAFIAPDGSLRQIAPRDTEALLYADIPLVAKHRTLVVRWSDWFRKVCVIFLVLFFVVRFFRVRFAKR